MFNFSNFRTGETSINKTMINVQNLVQTRAFARQDGAILGLVWIVSFAFTMLAVKPDQSFLGLIGNLLLIPL